MGPGHRRILLTLAALPGLGAQSAYAASETNDQPGPTTDDREIVVLGANPASALLSGMVAEAELDQSGIAAYGHDTVGQLLGEVLRQTGSDDEGLVILINGQPTSGLNAISDLPTEAVAKIQLLPREAAGKLGERPSRRVVNVTIKPSHRQVTAQASAALATAGGGFAGEGELNLLRLENGNRRSLVFAAKHIDPLFESERPITVESAETPFGPSGNIIPDPAFGAEIDPLLSALAGQLVTVAGIPAGLANPALSDFAALANRPTPHRPGDYRTLLSEQRNYSLNANLTQKLGGLSTLSLNFKAAHSRTQAATGAANATFSLPATSAFSPFGRDVLIARTIGEPLRNRQEGTDLNFAAIFNTQIGKWRLSASASIVHRALDADNHRRIDTADYETGISAGTVNPFAPGGDARFGPVLSDRSSLRGDLGSISLTAAGSPLSLPAGPLNASLRIGWQASRNRSQTIGETATVSTRLGRDEAFAQLSLQIPLVGGRQNSAIGDLSLDLAGTLRNVTAAGSLRDYSGALNWRPDPALSLRAGISEEQFAPPLNQLTDPIIITDGVRTFDFIRQETVFVRQITGGNPDLAVETRRTTSVSGNLQPFEGPDFTINAEYARVVNRDAYAALPPVDAAVQAAFPDRFQRDVSGTLVAVDARPVGFARQARSQLRWGFNFSRNVRGNGARTATPDIGDTAPSEGVLAPGLRISAFATHIWTLSSTRLARSGLPLVDLLDGTAVGSGGGLPRHVAQFGGGAAAKGLGLRISASLFGARKVAGGTVAAPQRTDFAARTQFDLRLFANLGPVFGASRVAQGARVSVEIRNLFDSKQRVTDQAGQTPLLYQPYLVDPVGRQISLKFRKVF